MGKRENEIARWKRMKEIELELNGSELYKEVTCDGSFEIHCRKTGCGLYATSSMEKFIKYAEAILFLESCGVSIARS